MNAEQFEGVFLRLGRSSREVPRKLRLNRFGRPTIGKFGIGFIAAVPFAEKIRVETASESCNHVHGVEIDCLEIMHSSETRDLDSEKPSAEAGAGKADDPNVPPAEFRFPGWDRDRSSSDPKSFTSVRLERLTRLAYDSIDAQLTGSWYQPKKERKKPITRAARERFVTVWLSRILPLGYTNPEGDEELQKVLRGFLPRDYYPIQVAVNGIRIHRPLAEAVLKSEPFDLKGEGAPWRARGILWSPQSVIEPYYLRGIPMRIGDMAIGQPSYFNINEMGRVYGKLQHITGEVHLEGFGDLLSLDRQRLKGSVESDEFLPRMRDVITKFESELQAKAAVMEAARNLKKLIEAQYPAPMEEPTLAPVLVAGDEAEKLIKRARDAGIQVKVTDKDEIEVPRGERAFTIGRNLGRDLLTIGHGKRQVKVVVKPSKPELTDDELVRAILSDGPELAIRGSHVLLSDDAWALGNLRVMALMRVGVREGRLNPDQVSWIVRTLKEMYE